MRSTGRVRRWLGRVALTLLGLVCTVLLALTILLGTAPGRRLVLDTVLPMASRVIPGTVTATALDQLDGTGLRLRGLAIHDPTGAEVLRLEHLAIDWDLFAAFSGRFIVHELHLARGFVDLRQEADARRGLLPALIDPEAPDESEDTSAEPPYVRVERLVVDDFALFGPELPAVGALDLRDVELSGSFELDGQPQARLEHAQATISRGDTTLGAIESLRVDLERGATPSKLKLRGMLAGSPLGLEVALVLPPEPTWSERELRGTFEIEGVTSGALAELLNAPGQADAYHGPLTYRAEVFGTPDHPELRSVLTTAAGEVHLDADLRQGEKATLQLSTTRLMLARLRTDLPRRRLDLRLEATADLEAPGDAVPISVNLERAAVDGEPLPSVEASGRVGSDSISELRLRLADARSRLVARGNVTFDGTGQLQGAGDLHAETIDRVLGLLEITGQARGWTSFRFSADRDADERIVLTGLVDTEGIEVGDQGVESAHLRWDVRGSLTGPTGGQPPDLEIDVQGRVEGARIAGQLVERARLTLKGGPERYALALHARAERSRLSANLTGKRFGDALALQGSLEGAHQDVPFELSLTGTRVGFDGSVTAREILLHVAGQRLQLSGAASSEAVDLHLQTGPVRLSELGRALDLAEPLAGQLNLRASVTGAVTAPSVGVQATLLGATLGQRPRVDMLLDGRLDAASGELAFELTTRGAVTPSWDDDASTAPAPSLRGAPDPTHPDPTHPDPSFRLTANGKYDFPGGSSWASTISSGDGTLSVDLDELDLAFVDRWLPGTSLPLVGTVRAGVEARGSLKSPRIDAHLDSDFRRKGSEIPLNLSALLRLEHGVLSAFGRVGDPGGSLADLAVSATLPKGSTDVSPLGRIAALPSDGRWTVHLLTPERDLRGAGFVASTDAVPPLAYAAELSVHHEPHGEPDGFLRARVRQLAPYPTDSPCSGGPLQLDLQARLADGQLWGEARGSSPSAALFEARGGLELQLASALAGGSVRSGPFDAHFLANRVQFAALPLLCNRIHGELTARARLRGPTGSAPHLDLELDAKEVTLGAPTTVDLQLRAKADVEHAGIEARILAPEGRSDIQVNVPLAWTQGSVTLREDAPLRGEVTLRELPLAPLVPPDGPISYAVGRVDGQIALRGTLGAPDLDGMLELHDVGFTATDVAQPLRDVKGRLRFTERTLRIEDFRAHDRDGSLALDGHVTLGGPDRIQSRVDLTTRKFPLRQLGQVLATVDADATIHTDVTPDQTNVRVTVEDVHVWIESTDLRRGISLDDHPDFAIDGVDPAAPEPDTTDTTSTAEAAPLPPPEPRERDAPSMTDASEGSSDGRLTRVDVETRGRFWVNRKDFAVRLAADLQAESRGEATVVRGEVSIERGYVMLLGRVFDLQRDSRLEFVGASPPDPILDLTAIHENRRSGQRISLRIGGRASEPELTFFVDGNRAEPGTALLALYGSQRTTEDPKTAERQAAGFVGGLTAGLLATSARRRLGAAAPILMLDPGDQLGEGRVRAGLELDALVPQFLRNFITGVYFEGIVARESTAPDAAGATPQSAQQESRLQGGVLLEFYFPEGFFNTNQYGPGATWSVDFGWQL